MDRDLRWRQRPQDHVRSSAIPRSFAPRTRPPAPQGPSRPPRRLSMTPCRVASGCHGGRRGVGRSCPQNWGKSLKQRKKWPNWTVGSRGNEQRPRGGDCVTGGGPLVASPARPLRFCAERDVGGSPRSRRCLGTLTVFSNPGRLDFGAKAAVRGHLVGSSDGAGRFFRSGPGRSLTHSDVVLAWGLRLRLGPVPGSSRGQPGFPYWPDFKLYEGYADGGHGGSGR